MIIIFLDGEKYVVANVTIGSKLGEFTTREEAEKFMHKVLS
jgi:hypothetical protein